MTTKLLAMPMRLFLLCITMTSLSFAQTYTFTHGTATGNTGPDQAMMDTEYTGTSLDGTVTVTGGIQYWTVPVTGIYQIEAFGGQGYGSFGGRGAHISGEFNLTAGTTLKILVGQQAGDYLDFPATTYNHQFGGGGGSFVTDASNNPLVVAGGGGGNHGTTYLTQCDGQITEAGAAGLNASIIGAGGSAGSGGLQASSADAGGGLLGNGDGLAGGQAFVNGGLGGIDEGTGGFGCGGGTSSWNNYRGGGGGGYSGGGGGNNSSLCCPAGDGGGSYNAGTNPVNLAGVQLGHGQVIITFACIPGAGSLVPDAASLSDVTAACVVSALTPPTASNSCSSGIEATTNASLPINTVGTTTITWTYDDGQNMITQTQDIVITGFDTVAPVIDNPNLISYSSQCEFTPPTPTATDFCAGSINGVSNIPFPITTQGTNVITWTYDDGSGNTATQTQTITINDVAPPTPDVTALADVDGCNSVTLPSPTATDNCSGTIVGVSNVTFPITTGGVTTVTWTYDDGNGNISTQTQNVNLSLIDNSVTLTGTSLTATATGVSYQWIDCADNQAIQGVTGQSYTPPVTGNYAVEVSNAQCVDTSVCLLVDYTGLTELNSALVTIYPNPSKNGVFTVDFDGNMEQIIIVDALGRTIDVPTDLVSGKVDGTTLASGKYTVKVVTSDAVYTKGLVIIE